MNPEGESIPNFFASNSFVHTLYETSNRKVAQKHNRTINILDLAGALIMNYLLTYF